MREDGERAAFLSNKKKRDLTNNKIYNGEINKKSLFFFPHPSYSLRDDKTEKMITESPLRNVWICDI